MGDCYGVRMKLNRNNDIGIIMAVEDFINAHQQYGWHDDFRQPDGTIEHALEKIMPYTQSCGDGINYEAYFDASYGWFQVMIDFFETAATQLLNGSEITINSEGSCRICIRNGTSIITN